MKEKLLTLLMLLYCSCDININNIRIKKKPMEADNIEQIIDYKVNLDISLNDYQLGDAFNYKARITNISNEDVTLNSLGNDKALKVTLTYEDSTLLDFEMGTNLIRLYPNGYLQIEAKEDTLFKRISGAWVDYSNSQTDIPRLIAITQRSFMKNMKFEKEGLYDLRIMIDYGDTLRYEKSIGVGTYTGIR